jgi:hypothetical protein
LSRKDSGTSNFAGHDPLREALDDCGLADTRLADENGIVLLPPRQHFDCGFDLFGATDDRVELALAGERGEIARILVQVRGIGRRFDLAFLGSAADHLRDLLADRLRREPVTPQDIGCETLTLFREPGEQVFGANIGMAEFRRSPEGARKRILDTGRDADFTALLGVGIPMPTLLEELVAQVVNGDLELVEDRADDIAVSEREEQVLGIDLTASDVARTSGGSLEDFLGMGRETLGHTGGGAAAAAATPPGADGDGGACIPCGGLILGLVGSPDERATAKELATEKVIKQAAASAEKRLQGRTRALLTGQATVVHVAELHRLALTVDDDLGPHRRGSNAADVTQSVRHDSGPQCSQPRTWKTPPSRDSFSSAAQKATKPCREIGATLVCRSNAHQYRLDTNEWRRCHLL